jgi:L-aminopeptidase/D-esterase-like protein
VPGRITDVPGIVVGHWTDPVALTGCTVVLCPNGTMGSGEVRGGAPGTRETDLLRPGTLVQEVNAVLLTGGSAFGLAAADGVVRFLEERGIGFDAKVARVPIVTAAVLFDLGVGDPSVRPGPAEGYAACGAAGVEVAVGNVGAGTGATVAKLHGPDRALKGGLGTASARDGDLVVGAVAAVNAFGEILDDDGSPVAEARPAPDGVEEASGEDGEAGDAEPPNLFGTNTTLVVVATNATLSKERAHLLSLAGHDGIDRAVRPAHTRWDGDTVFTLATGQVQADQRQLEQLAAAVVAEAIRDGVRRGEGIPGYPSAGRPS